MKGLIEWSGMHWGPHPLLVVGMWLVLAAYTILYITGLYKLARSKRLLLFILSLFISPIAVVSAFIKIRRR